MKKILCSLLFTVLAAVSINAQSISVTGLGETINDGSITIDPLNDTDFGTLDIDGATDTHTFTITNTGTVSLDVGLNNLSNTVDFVQSTPPSPTEIAPGETSTFTVTFDPVLVGSKTSLVTITILNLSTFLPEPNFTFTVGGIGEEVIPPAEPIIGVFGTAGLDQEIFDSNPASPSNGTDFGDVPTDETLTNPFRISNSGTDDLIISNLIIPGGSSDFAIVESLSFPITVTPGNNFDFNVIYTPGGEFASSSNLFIVHNDNTPSTLSPFTMALTGNGIAPIPDEPEIDLLDNVGADLPIGGTVDFGQQDISTGNVQFTFTIENNGNVDLTLDDVSPFVVIGGANPADFTLSIVPSSTIIPTGNTTFAITFNPSDTSIRTATVSIANNDTDEDPYTFNLQGEGIDANLGSPLLITQYYEGIGVNDNWIEVKNVSSQSTNTGAFYLVIFKDAEATINGGIETKDPDDLTEAVLIPPLVAGGVALFSRSGALLPTTGNLGATPITTEVCSFDGNDVLVITTTDEGGVNGAYARRIDIIGTVGTNAAVDWGSDTSLIKGCGTTEAPSTMYDPNEYTVLTLDEVNNASSFIGSPALPNIALGTQTVGPTIWNGAGWDNGLPDQTKQAIIAGNYSGSTSFESCDLTINAGASIDLNSGNAYVLVDGDLAVNGSFSIGDTESLIMTDADAAISGQITKTEVSSLLNNSLDYTYWSSPVTTTIANAFSGANLNRVFEWRTADLAWFVAGGDMSAGRGYISQAPDGTNQHTINFVGAPNNGLKFQSVVFNDDGLDNDYTLLGNPYPSAIDIDQFILFVNNDEIRDNTDVDGTIYLWTHSTATNETNGSDPDYVGSDYATYNISGGIASANGGAAPTNNIGSGQGFFVRAKSNGTVFFQNNMRLDLNGDPLTNTQFFKSNAKKAVEKDRLWLDMTSDEGAFNQILVGFFDEATDAEDRAYDGTLLGGHNLRFYSKIDDTKYAIQGLGTYDQSKEITLGFDTTLDRTFKVEISNIEGILKTEEVYLYDNVLNILHDLKQGAYEFKATEGNYTDRFTLKFNSGVLNTDDIVLNNSFIVFNESNTLKIKAGVEISELRVYDITGRLLIDSEPNSSNFDVPSQQSIKTGTVLILNATMKDGSTISKKAIKY